MTSFLIDAQLPYQLKRWLDQIGCDCQHTLDLPKKNGTPDTEVAAYADENDRILVSKDGDFINLKILRNTPKRILLITTGNINNETLLRLFDANFDVILKLFKTHEIVELGNTFVVGKNLE